MVILLYKDKHRALMMVPAESRPKGYGHVALWKMAPLSSLQAMRILFDNVDNDSTTSFDGLYLYRPLIKMFDLSQTSLREGQKAAEVFPNVHLAIARLKTSIRGTH